MASSKVYFIFFVLLHSFFLPSHFVLSNEEEDNLLQGINSYRQSKSLPPLVKNGKADCLADEVADDLEDQPCSSLTRGVIVPSTQTRVSNYPKQLNKCNINVNTIQDGVILPVCVPHLVPTLVLTNYTQSQYSKYLNDSKFSGVGVGSQDDWMVLVLSTNAPSGSFSGAVSLVSPMASFFAFLFLILGSSLFVLS